MRQLPKAIPELDGGLFLPRPVVELVDAVLIERDRALRLSDPAAESLDLRVLTELRPLLRLGGLRLPVPASFEQLGLVDPQAEAVGRNLLRD